MVPFWVPSGRLCLVVFRRETRRFAVLKCQKALSSEGYFFFLAFFLGAAFLAAAFFFLATVRPP